MFVKEERFPQQEMSERWPVSFFLCSDSGDGRYLKTLLVLMATAQNELLGAYRDLKNTTRNSNTFELQKKKCVDLEQDDVIAFLEDQDLIPLVFLNAHFSLRAAEGRRLSYSFDDIENAVLERVCRNRVLVDTTSVPMYRYRDEIRGTDHFFNLSRKIRQVNKIKHSIQ